MLTASSTLNTYDRALKNVDSAANALRLTQDAREMTKHSERVLIVTVPPRTDDDHIRYF